MITVEANGQAAGSILSRNTSDSKLIMLRSGNENHNNEYKGYSDKELQDMIDDPNVSQADKKKIQEQQKANGNRNKNKNRGKNRKKPKSKEEKKKKKSSEIVIDWETVKEAAKNTSIVIGTIIIIAGILYIVSHIILGLLVVLVLV